MHMNENITTLPNWAKEILETLKCDESKITLVAFEIYFGANSFYNFTISEEDDKGKPTYVVTYSRRDHLMPDDEDKNAIVNRLVPLLGKPIGFREGVVCDSLIFDRKVN